MHALFFTRRHTSFRQQRNQIRSGLINSAIPIHEAEKSITCKVSLSCLMFWLVCFQVYYYQSGKDIIPNPYKGRIQPPSSPATTRNASIIINNMQPSDSGVYSCEVHNFPDVDGQSQVNIVVNVLGELHSVSWPLMWLNPDEQWAVLTDTCTHPHSLNRRSDKAE